MRAGDRTAAPGSLPMADDSVTNFCFHGIGRPQRNLEPGEAAYWIGADFFHRVLDQLVGRSDVAISFDDGNASDQTDGLPALVERGLTATFFALAGRLGQAGSVDGSALRELRTQGMSIGSHGMHHVPWRALNEATRREELEDARAVLAEASEGAVVEAALPLGRYDRRVLTQLRILGYQRVYSSDRLAARQGDWFQPRYSVRADDTPETIRRLLQGPTRREAVLGGAKILAKRWR
jgi:peptidoglycan/xylan/chitin deacetylase (PgdA/CDA1 family)